MQIWDTAGQEKFKNMIKVYFKGAHSIILVYDITNRESFEELRDRFLPDVLSIAS